VYADVINVERTGSPTNIFKETLVNMYFDNRSMWCTTVTSSSSSSSSSNRIEISTKVSRGVQLSSAYDAGYLIHSPRLKSNDQTLYNSSSISSIPIAMVRPQ
jgi:hypothetical protein